MQHRDSTRRVGPRVRFAASVSVISLGIGLGLTPWGITAAHASVVTVTDANGVVYEADSADPGAGAVVTEYTGSSQSVTIPATVEIGTATYDVTAIGTRSFTERGLTDLTFEAPSNVTTIGEEAFSRNSLSSLTIPTSVMSIERCAFFVNSLSTVTFASPSSLTTIGDCAFHSNGMTAVSIPPSVTTIGAESFAINDFATIDFEAPSGLTEIGYKGFFEHWGQISARNLIAELALPSSLVSIDDSAFFGTGIERLTFSKPSSLTSIGEHAFANNRFTSLEIPASLSNVERSAFGSGYIETITFDTPSSLSVIGPSMFSSNPLESVSIPDTVTTISGSAFSYTGLTHVTIPGSVTSIGPNAFFRNNLTTVVIPESVSSIGDYAFDQNYDLTSVIFEGDRPFSVSSLRPFGPAGNAVVHFPCDAAGFAHPLWLRSTYETSTVCEISFLANGGVGMMPTAEVATGDPLPTSTFTRDDFYFSGWSTSADGTGLLVEDEQPSAFIAQTVLYAQWVPATAPQCFTHDVGAETAVVVDYDPECGGPDVVLPASTVVGGESYLVTAIGAAAFEGATIASVAIPYGITTIGERAFFDNALSEVSIPSSVEAIGHQAFDGNPDLQRVTFSGGAPVVMGSAADGRPLGSGAATVHYRAGATGFTHPTWFGYSTRALHELRFEANNGSGAMFPLTLTTGDSLPSTTYTRFEWRFSTWNTAADGSGVSVDDGAPSPFVADTVLYAQWVPDTEPPILSSPGTIVNTRLFPCNTGPERAVISTTRPTLSVVATDPERGNTWTIFTLTDMAGAVLWQSSPSLSSPVHQAMARVSAGILPLEGVFQWRAQSYDSREVYSEYSPWCEFRIDVTKPASPVVTPIEEGSQAVYPEGETAGGVGRTGVFQLDAGEESDAVRFRYSFSSDSMRNWIDVGPDGTARVSYTPTSTFPVTLYVATVDEAGNQSNRVSYQFRVGVLRTVSFAPNQGTGSMASVVESTSTALPSNTFSRPGYRFIGWNTAANGTGTAVPDGAVWPFTSSTSLYAQWERNEIAAIELSGPTAVFAGATATYTVQGFDEFGAALGNVDHEVTLSSPTLTVFGANVSFPVDPSAAAGSVSSHTLTATVNSAHSITDVVTIEVRVAAEFSDVPASRPFAREIAWLAGSRITSGYSDGTFRPLESVNRDAMAAFLYRFAGRPAFTPPETSPFSDVTPTTPFYKEITWLATTGITGGFSDGTYRPQGTVNRDAMAAFLYRFAGRPAFTPPATSPFTDISPATPFYTEITWLASTGITGGFSDGTFRAVEPVKRDAMAAFLFRFSDLRLI